MTAKTNPPLPETGKVGAETFERVIRPRLGAARDDVLVGPCPGIDTGIVDLGGGQVMALTTDPFFVMPELGWERAAWFAVQIVASDAATSGLPPAYLAVDLNLPPEVTDDDLAALWAASSEACDALDIAVVTGHTGRYEGCAFPMLGGATVAAIGRKDRFVTPAMARPGDRIVITKGAAIETAGMFGTLCPRLIAAACGTSIAHAAAALFWRMSTVDDARVAAQVGVRDAGVSGMHDATERGIWGGLAELAAVAGVGMSVDRDAILLPAEARAVCELFAIDPYETSSEGTLLITCAAEKTAEVVARLGDAGIAATCVGEITPASHASWVESGGRRWPLAPGPDPFWPALRAAMEVEARHGN